MRDSLLHFGSPFHRYFSADNLLQTFKKALWDARGIKLSESGLSGIENDVAVVAGEVGMRVGKIGLIGTGMCLAKNDVTAAAHRPDDNRCSTLKWGITYKKPSIA